MVILSSLVLILGMGFIICILNIRRYKENFRHQGLFRKWPIRRVSLDEISPFFKTHERGPSKETEIYFISSYRVPGSINDIETWILCNLAKTAKAIFEFGTFTGKTAYLLAKNAPKDGKVYTLTLSPEELSSYKEEKEDKGKDTKVALQESVFDQFYYSDTDVSHKITQLFGDSKDFDETPYLNSMDLIFIDGSHARSYVESDSQKALRMLKPGGFIFWHDYRGPRRARGVFDTLNKLQKKLKLMHISGTSLVVYQQKE